MSDVRCPDCNHTIEAHAASTRHSLGLGYCLGDLSPASSCDCTLTRDQARAKKRAASNCRAGAARDAHPILDRPVKNPTAATLDVLQTSGQVADDPLASSFRGALRELDGDGSEAAAQFDRVARRLGLAEDEK